MVGLERPQDLARGGGAERDDVHAELTTEVAEELEERGWLDRLDDDRDRYAHHAGEPEARPLPPAQVGQGDDRAAVVAMDSATWPSSSTSGGSLGGGRWQLQRSLIESWA